MQYAICTLNDLGFVDGNGKPLASIDGRDNRTEPFRHLGVAGYPESAVLCIDQPGEAKTTTLAILPDGAGLPENGKEIAAADVRALLVASYGFPAGTTLGLDGLPAMPAGT
jgi:hypothetical protein